MPQSLSQIFIHLVFSTKHRQPYLNETISAELYAYMAAVLHDECKSPARIIGGVDDHVHVLLNLSRTLSISSVVEAIKTSTSKWIKTKGCEFAGFAWQAGYGAFSVSASNLDTVIRYIKDQRSHHAKASFQDELRGLLTKHKVEYDERYVWD